MIYIISKFTLFEESCGSGEPYTYSHYSRVLAIFHGIHLNFLHLFSQAVCNFPLIYDLAVTMSFPKCIALLKFSFSGDTCVILSCAKFHYLEIHPSPGTMDCFIVLSAFNDSPHAVVKPATKKYIGYPVIRLHTYILAWQREVLFPN